MPLILVYIGAAPNDGTGDDARTAFGKINDALVLLDGDKAAAIHTHVAADIEDFATALSTSLLNLPTSPPATANKLWWDGNVLKRSS